MITRRNFLAAGGYGALAGCTAGLVYEQIPPGAGIEKVLLIGVDGLRPDALQQTPNIDRLMAEGAYSLAARTGKYTVSCPGWFNILTGVWETKHGVKDNSLEPANHAAYPTLFTRLEQYHPGLNTYCIASLDWITKFIVGKADRKIYHPFEQEGDRRVAETAAQVLAQRPVDLMFAYFMGVDMAGHEYGFSRAVPEYMAKVRNVDGYVGMLMKAIRKRPTYNKECWLTVFVSDHGGKGKHHEGVGEEAMKVPLILHGSTVQPGEITPVPRQVDVAPTILTHLNVPIRHGWGLDGKVVGFKESYMNGAYR